ncbi:DUF4214 domain-containing protein [Cellulomonas marina]|uniref:Outer membrane protein assembly factor BamB, contains PQQ-like beta-propeller repeat n=1 Tax=Cellulomonas marina TaxID=988821 RepID=A0A1I0UYZ5_9CELL|nr:DUF4214 domain-containing protein [Cellulomonas marina]GIG29907.1 hypothetical protein Cma02nite_25070 [Cellulomonas marina]SFA69275.1 Outer membrane protein assembly factor BamB, contains PQQ-like beta-propeller repeat [Cellulomonas marina]
MPLGHPRTPAVTVDGAVPPAETPVDRTATGPRGPRPGAGRSRARRLVALVAAATALAPLAALPEAPEAHAASAQLTPVTTNGGPFSVQPLTPFGGPVLDSGATGEIWSSAAVGDVSGDGVPEIVVGGGLSSALKVYSLDGGLRHLVDLGGVDVGARSGGVQPSPVLVDLDLDGVLDVAAASTANVVAGYRFRGGSVTTLWRRQDPPIVPSGPNGILGTPATGYVDADGYPDLVTGSWGQGLTAMSGGNGGNIAGWPKWLWDTIWSSPAVGDVDGDGADEVVVGGDCAGNDIGTQPCGNVGGGYVWVFNRDGSEKWRWFLQGQVVWSSPALADLNGDGGLDVVVGTGGYFDDPAGRVLTALDGRTGRVLWQAGMPARVVGSPSVADVTGDGRADVFVVSYGGWLLSVDGATGAPRWRACLTDGGTCGDPGIGTKSGVALADVDGDGAIEAITQGEQQLRVYDAHSGRLEWSRGSGYAGTVLAPANTPTVAQVDGQTWIVQPLRGYRDVNGQRQHELVVGVWRTGAALGAAPWRTARGNMARTGAVPVPGPSSAQLRQFVDQVYRDFLGRPPSAGDLSGWTDRLVRRQASRYEVATSLSRSDEWVRHVITEFYRDTLGREPDAAGLAGWVRAAQGGMPVAQVAAAFYASPEYYARTAGNDPGRWVSDLYTKLLGRGADASGRAGWVGAMAAGMPRDQLALGFYQSDESVQVRVDGLYRELLGRPADAGGVGSWRQFVRDHGDLVLASALAASAEYLTRARS